MDEADAGLAKQLGQVFIVLLILGVDLADNEALDAVVNISRKPVHILFGKSGSILVSLLNLVLKQTVTTRIDKPGVICYDFCILYILFRLPYVAYKVIKANTAHVLEVEAEDIGDHERDEAQDLQSE